jgi:hypothetical protein
VDEIHFHSGRQNCSAQLSVCLWVALLSPVGCRELTLSSYFAALARERRCALWCSRVGGCRASRLDIEWITINGAGPTSERDWLRVLGAGTGIYALLTLARAPRISADDAAKDVQMAPLVEVEKEPVVVAFDFDKCLMIRHW